MAAQENIDDDDVVVLMESRPRSACARRTDSGTGTETETTGTETTRMAAAALSTPTEQQSFLRDTFGLPDEHCLGLVSRQMSVAAGADGPYNDRGLDCMADWDSDDVGDNMDMDDLDSMGWE